MEKIEAYSEKVGIQVHGGHGSSVAHTGDRVEALAVLHNAAGNLGISLGFNIQQLPVLSL
jgi:hypothetical protein